MKNPLLSEEVKLEALQKGASPLFSSHIPFANTVPLHQPNSSNFPPPSQHSSTNQSNSSSSISSPRMAQPQNRMAAMVAAIYDPLVLAQPLNALLGGDYQKYLLRFNGQGDVIAEEHWNTYMSYVDNRNFENEDV